MIPQISNVLGHRASFPFLKGGLISLLLPTAYNLGTMVNSGAHPSPVTVKGWAYDLEDG